MVLGAPGPRPLPAPPAAMHAARTPRSLPSLAPRQADQEVRAAPTRPAGCCPVGGGRPQTGASRRVPRREARPLAPSQALLLVPSQSLRNPRLRLCFRISDSSEQPASSAPRKTVPRETGTLPTDSSETPRSRLTGPQGNSHAGHAAVALFLGFYMRIMLCRSTLTFSDLNLTESVAGLRRS